MRRCFSAAVLFVTLSCCAQNDFVGLAYGQDSFPEQFVTAYCLDCHGNEAPEADFSLENIGQDVAADVWHRVFQKVSNGTMPPEDELQPSDEERERLLAWVAKRFGTPPKIAPTNHWSFQPLANHHQQDSKAAKSTTGYPSIDSFVEATLQQHQLKMSPATDRATLLRRVTLDLTGLPPTPDEVVSFESDPAPLDVAYGKVVSRLLRSPRYGERWAQHWLDVIRWAETVGFETNLQRPHAWHYRDWVIDAFNDDMPYDQFVFEQLAGDTIGNDAALGFLVAGPANLPGQIGRDEEAMRQARQDALDETIRTVSQAFFGLTIGCARCHDHKFDPVTQADYYSMQAIFSGLRYGNRRLRGDENDAWTARLPHARQKLTKLQKDLSEFRDRHELRHAVDTVTSERFAARVANSVRIEILATNGGPASLYEFEVFAADALRTESENTQQVGRNVALASHGAKANASSYALANQTRHFDNLIDGSVDPRQAFPWVAAKSGIAWVEIELDQPTMVDHVAWRAGSSMPTEYRLLIRETPADKWDVVADSNRRILHVSDRRSASDVRIDSVPAEEIERLVRLLAAIRTTSAEVAKLSAGPQTYAASFDATVPTTFLLRRGDPMQRERIVAPAVPAFLRSTDTPQTFENEAERRVMLAKHLTNPQHPLTARVIVNRVWQHHFGTGLVETPSDFGHMGAAPSHPELLDWLAKKLVENDWSLKWLHRQIVFSKTYRQSSRPNPAAQSVDAESRLFWRYPPRRLEAEAIRDSILAASGKLNLTMYGPGFDFFNQRGGLSDYHAKETFDESGWRRMIYAHKIRMQSVDVFGTFDCPDAGQMTPKRNQSVTPLQTLGLFNSPFAIRQATFFAERLRRERPGNLASQIEHAFYVVASRIPNETEQKTMTTLAEEHGLDQACRVLLNSSEFVFQR